MQGNPLINVVLGGTPLPFPDSQILNGGITVDGTNTIFTVTTTGQYLIDYKLDVTAVALFSTELIINGLSGPLTRIIPV
ncbi:hypothetical protein AB0H28_30025, partial [Micromonospora sp. NPDC050980]|uniref:BclA C-terminal domain-containing protein n=1 Tax=Micromonospora sp. NPDC050980 TaxID=3155161 RepID=UPI0033C5FC01